MCKKRFNTTLGVIALSLFISSQTAASSSDISVSAAIKNSHQKKEIKLNLLNQVNSDAISSDSSDSRYDSDLKVNAIAFKLLKADAKKVIEDHREQRELYESVVTNDGQYDYTTLHLSDEQLKTLNLKLAFNEIEVDSLLISAISYWEKGVEGFELAHVRLRNGNRRGGPLNIYFDEDGYHIRFSDSETFYSLDGHDALILREELRSESSASDRVIIDEQTIKRAEEKKKRQQRSY